MRRAICLALLLIVASPVLLMAQQVAGTQCWINGKLVGGFPPGYNCPGTGGGSGSGGGYAAGNAQLQQAVQQATTNFLNWLFNAGANAQAAAAQRQQMMAELQRRQAEAARQHREEEARRLAEMYNRLSATLKLNGLPNLQLKNSGISASGLQMKLGDNTQGYGIPGLPGIYTGGPGQGSGMTPVTESKLQLKMGDDAGGAAHVGNPNLPGLALNDGQQSYGIPGLPGIYTGGPGSGSGMTPAAGPGLQMKMGDGNATPPAATGEAFDPRTVDVDNMTPKQAADMAEYVSKLPPEEQQRLIAAAQNGGAPPQSAPILPTTGSAPGAAAQVSGEAAPGISPMLTTQTAAQPVAALQQQANASQAAATATVPEDMSSKARIGFDTGLGAVATPPAVSVTSGQPAYGAPQVPAAAATVSPRMAIPVATPMTPVQTNAGQPAGRSAAVTPALSTAQPPNRQVEDLLREFLFPANATSSHLFPKNPNPQLTNPLREKERLQAELKAWDDWALEHATHIYDRPDDDGMLYPLATELAALNLISVKQFAPDLLGRYSTDSAFRQSVDVRLQHATEDGALDYYQGLADVHKATILAFHVELDKLAAAGKLDERVSLEDQYQLHPERRQIVQAAWDRASANEETALAKAQADGSGKLDKQYQFVFQLIRKDTAQ
jgi:hypothetical protein